MRTLKSAMPYLMLAALFFSLMGCPPIDPPPPPPPGSLRKKKTTGPTTRARARQLNKKSEEDESTVRTRKQPGREGVKSDDKRALIPLYRDCLKKQIPKRERAKYILLKVKLSGGSSAEQVSKLITRWNKDLGSYQRCYISEGYEKDYYSIDAPEAKEEKTEDTSVDTRSKKEPPEVLTKNEPEPAVEETKTKPSSLAASSNQAIQLLPNSVSIQEPPDASTAFVQTITPREQNIKKFSWWHSSSKKDKRSHFQNMIAVPNLSQVSLDDLKRLVTLKERYSKSL